MLSLLTNQASSNISQPPGDDNLGASTSGQDHSPLIRHCLGLLASISAAVDRNTKMTDMVADYIMHGHSGATGATTPGATGETTSSSAVQDPEDENDENVFEVKTRRFRARAKLPKRKSAGELRLRVSHVSTTRPRCFNITTGRSP